MVDLFDFDNSYSILPDRMFAQVNPEPAPSPSLLGFNAPLAADLGYRGTLSNDDLATVISGKVIPDSASPIAQAYAGHQFGNFVPSLGLSLIHI